MSFLKSSQDLLNEILTISGELTDGTSQFINLALLKMNSVHRSLVFGGNEFGVDVNEPWIWAQSKRPIVFQLMPRVTTTATLTNGQLAGVFPVAPSVSLEGRHMKIESRSDFYRVAQHTAGSVNFQLDQPYLDATGTLNANFYKVDYDLFDDTIIVDATNNKLDFSEGGSALLATLTNGSYSTADFCTHVATKMTAAGTKTYSVSIDPISRLFTVSSSGTSLSLLFGTGANAIRSASILLGFDVNDQTGAVSYQGQYSLSAIARISKPMTVYHNGAVTGSPRDTNKIFMVDDNTFLREYPLNRICEKVPDKFCQVAQTTEGLWTVRMNASVMDDPIRAETNFIGVPRDLFNSPNSFPLVPDPFTDFLVFGGAHFVLTEKKDSQADYYYKLAQAKLQALISYNRKGLSLGGNNFGKLVPRREQLSQMNRRFF